MRAGLDIGSTLTKAVWQEDGEYKFASSADYEFGYIDLYHKLREVGVDTVVATGIGKTNDDHATEGITERRLPGDPIENEVNVQADGARRLLEMEGISKERFLLAGIGTGTSFSVVDGDSAVRFPIGTGMGGGFIEGVTEGCGLLLRQLLNDDCLGGRASHLTLGMVRREFQGSPLAELPVAYCRADRNTTHNFHATLMHTCASVILERIASMRFMKPPFELPDSVVFVGSVVQRLPVFREYLEEGMKTMGFIMPVPELIFLEKGEYAGALGAYHAELD